jgi:hypothetical protein
LPVVNSVIRSKDITNNMVHQVQRQAVGPYNFENGLEWPQQDYLQNISRLQKRSHRKSGLAHPMSINVCTGDAPGHRPAQEM